MKMTMECGGFASPEPGGSPFTYAALILIVYLLSSAGIRFSRRLARQPVEHPEKQRQRNDQPRIARRKPHLTQHDNITRSDPQRWNQYDNQGAVHHLTCDPFMLPAGIAPCSYPSPTKSHPQCARRAANLLIDGTLPHKTTSPPSPPSSPHSSTLPTH